MRAVHSPRNLPRPATPQAYLEEGGRDDGMVGAGLSGSNVHHLSEANWQGADL